MCNFLLFRHIYMNPFICHKMTMNRQTDKQIYKAYTKLSSHFKTSLALLVFSHFCVTMRIFSFSSQYAERIRCHVFFVYLYLIS